MEMACLDLEGVLIPEIWINVAERTGIESLRATTRDIPDYDELMQQRLRILAARVIGAHQMMDGASFVDVFRSLSRFGFSPRASFNVTLRLYRGGGYTKDLIYLRGLLGLLEYLAAGGALAPLFVGLVAQHEGRPSVHVAHEGPDGVGVEMGCDGMGMLGHGVPAW